MKHKITKHWFLFTIFSRQYLDYFCKYQSEKRAASSLSWDHALLLTGIDERVQLSFFLRPVSHPPLGQDLYSYPSMDKGSSGMAFLSGMCSKSASCTLAEARWHVTQVSRHYANCDHWPAGPWAPQLSSSPMSWATILGWSTMGQRTTLSVTAITLSWDRDWAQGWRPGPGAPASSCPSSWPAMASVCTTLPGAGTSSGITRTVGCRGKGNTADERYFAYFWHLKRFDGDSQCNLMYGTDWRLYPSGLVNGEQINICSSIWCRRGNSLRSPNAAALQVKYCNGSFVVIIMHVITDVSNVSNDIGYREPTVVLGNIVIRESASCGTLRRSPTLLSQEMKLRVRYQWRSLDQLTLIRCLFVTSLPFSVLVILIAVHERKEIVKT